MLKIYEFFFGCVHDWHYDPNFEAACGRHRCLKCHKLGRYPVELSKE